MKEVIRIFQEIMGTTKKNEKLFIIRSNKDNELFKKSLRFLLDGDITTGISQKKIEKNIPFCRFTEVNSLEECLDYVTENNSGRDKDVKTVQMFLEKVDEDDRDIIQKLFTKKLKLGCAVNTANTAIPGLIKTWEVQQAYLINDKNKPKIGEKFFLSQKLNGNNCGVLDYKLISRQGKEFVGLDHIVSDLKKLPFKDMFFNGELIRNNSDGLSDEDNFQLGTGIINSDKDTDKTSIEFVIYEMFPADEFLAGESKLKYGERRRQYLNPLAEKIAELGLNYIRVVPIIYEGTDQSVIEGQLYQANLVGWEGLMLNKDTKWQNKRNNGILKIKTFFEADLLCTGIVEGQGKYEGTLGLIECDYKGYTLGVGSGFTDEQRDYYWKHPEMIVNHVVEIKYKNETKNKQGGLSVQFPVFQCVREEGKEVSYE